MNIFVKENLLKTREHLSPSGKYKLVIETFKTGPQTWNYTKGSVYSTHTNDFCGSIERNYPHFPFLFFFKDNKEYLVSGKSYLSQSIINCQTGHTYESQEKKDNFCWSQMWQVDENTICVCGCFWGGPYIYSFYDFSDISLGWPELEIKVDENIKFPVEKMEYFLTNNDLAGQHNYPDPEISNHQITFTVKESRVIWAAKSKLSNDVKEINMEVGDYLEQLQEPNGFEIYNYKEKIQKFDKLKMTWKRIENKMVLIDFWRNQSKLLDE